MRMRILFLLALALAVPLPLHARNTDGLGMWVWSSSSYGTEEARQALVRFCLQHRISHLDVHTTITWQGAPVLENAAALRDLFLLAGTKNISTAILRGEPRMFFASNHGRALEELRVLLAFSRALPEGTLFKGIKYDVEPYLTEEWKTAAAAREAAMRDYLTFLGQARSVLHAEAPGLWLAADIPFWWDNDEFLLAFEGQTKRMSEHVQDLTDFVVIMSYKRSAQKVLACVEGERNYALRMRKLVRPSVETIRLPKDPHSSFWGVPAEEFWKTVYQLQERALEDPALGGVMIHSYRGLREKLGGGDSAPPFAGHPP